MMEYFDAAQAHKVTKTYRNSKIEKELDSIYEKIKLAVQKGEYSVTLDYYRKEICQGTIQMLKDKGFNVKEFNGDQRDPAHDIIISW